MGTNTAAKQPDSSSQISHSYTDTVYTIYWVRYIHTPTQCTLSTESVTFIHRHNAHYLLSSLHSYTDTVHTIYWVPYIHTPTQCTLSTEYVTFIHWHSAHSLLSLLHSYTDTVHTIYWVCCIHTLTQCTLSTEFVTYWKKNHLVLPITLLELVHWKWLI